MAATQHPLPLPPGPDKHDGSKPRGTLLKIILVLAVILIVLLLIGLVPRLLHGPKLHKTAQQNKDSTPTVDVVLAKKAAPFDALNLPGNIQAVQQAAIVARATGYVKQRFADIGDRVQAGQLLAILATPELDQQVAQARAQVTGSQAAAAQARANVSTQRANLAEMSANAARAEATLAQARTQRAQAQAAQAQAAQTNAQQAAQLTQAVANLNLARVTAQRYQNLLADGAVDQQSADQNAAAYQSSLANVQALQSAVRAGRANTAAAAAAVRSSTENIKAYQQGVAAGRAQVAAAAANVRSFEENVRAADANIGAAQANLARTVALQGFGRVTAPFAGVVTARSVDVGSLVSAGGGAGGGSDDTTSVGTSTVGATAQGNAAGGGTQGAGAPGSGSSTGTGGSSGGAPTSLFSIAQVGDLRIYLNVPQTYADVVRPGQDAEVRVKEVPGRAFAGRIIRTSGALDATTRTLVTEVRLANTSGLLRPGMFADVHLRVPNPSGALLVPDSALVTNAGGTQVLVVQPKGTLHFQPISVGRDFGKVFQALSGLKAGQSVVTNPNDALKEGEKVHAISAPPPPQGG